VRLNAHPNIVAIKEATGSLDIASEIAHATADHPIAIISGDDSMTLPLMSVGGVGVISVLSNLLPDKVKAVVDAAAAGDFATAKQKHLELFGLCKGCLTLATNPIPLKAAMQIAGMDTGEVRLPLTELEDEPRKKLQALLDSVLPVTAAK
ncbi:MAG: dihydrodipicolinate synthase family protein, partial [Planctomycetota bacterium]